MELLLMLLLPLPIGLFVKNKIVGYLIYVAAHGFAFTFQSTVLLLAWVGGDTSAFGPYPDASAANVWPYGAVNLLIFLVGIGLVALGHRLTARRTAKRQATSGASTATGSVVSSDRSVRSRGA
ncbi:hypothetical protein [Leekyejoonella antrihumi]|uniref:Integral membrane protein n=1 Tax=Leekyejoonella antrihumi TaxID=1660198 RepID=A0A563E764_9MICO|nr:hypothetical protein [Leekyejoonella antrihumi]TWP38337.1 hypothetical protein FGL98_03775 [Leekyejoonella antrihumi]